MKAAFVLCSGGLDSVTTAHYVKDVLKYDKVVLVFFDYGQRSLYLEQEFSKECAKTLKVEWISIELPFLKKQKSSALVNTNIQVPSKDSLNNTSEENKQWYVPCRNLIFLSCVLSMADAGYFANKEKWDIFVGFKNEGVEGFVDATPEFIKAMNNVAKTSKAGTIYAPFILKDKEDIISQGIKLRVNYARTFSCYSPIKDKHCGSCLACRLRKAGFKWANAKDPTTYVN